MSPIPTATALRGPARRLRFVAAAGALIILLLPFLATFVPNLPALGVFVRLDADGLPRAAAATVAMASGILLAGALWELCRMLSRVEEGQAFAPVTTRHFKRFAALLMVSALANVILPNAIRFWVGRAAQGSIELTAGAKDLLFLFLTVVLVFVAGLLEQAARFEEDSRSIV